MVAIPAPLLFHPEGRLVATGLRGPALAKELAHYLK